MSEGGKFAILRTQKLKSTASIGRSLRHSFREQLTPNADSELLIENTHYGAASAAEAIAGIEQRLPEKRRSDAVLAIEYLVTASPEALNGRSRGEQDQYFTDALEWLRERHGAQNVVYAGIHRDEMTPHLYAYVVPIDDRTGRLNAKKWLGGTKALRDMQTEFATKVGAKHGLERGVERSQANHQTVKQFYGNLQVAEQEQIEIDPAQLTPRVLKKGLFTTVREAPSSVAKRLSRELTQLHRPTFDKAATSVQEARRAAEMHRTAATATKDMAEAQKKLAAISGVFASLTQAQLTKIHAMVNSFRAENEQKKQLKAEQNPFIDTERMNKLREEQQRKSELSQGQSLKM